MTIEITEENDKPEIEKGLKLTSKENEIYESALVVSDVEESRGEQTIAVSLKDSSEFSIEIVDDKYVVRSLDPLSATTYRVIVDVNDGLESVEATYDIVVDAVLIAPSIETLLLSSATEDADYIGEIRISDNRVESVMVETLELPSWMEAESVIEIESVTSGKIDLKGRPSNGDVGTSEVKLRITDGVDLSLIHI